MFTVVPRSEIGDHRPVSGEPVPEVIDHRQQKQTGAKWQDARKHGQNTYESIKEQRDHLIQSEFKYKKRVKELEKEKEDLLKVYEPTYQENERLKGHLMHGPDAQKIKKLKQEKRQLLSELEIVKEENGELIDRVKELEKMFVSEKNYYLEKKWRDAIERGRKRREENDKSVSTQGPFANSKKPNKRNLKTVKDEEFEKQDKYDLHIDSLEKETQILLNKIRSIKQNKESINYAFFIGKGAITRNAAMANAINEKLERDLETFEDRLEKLRKKTLTFKADASEDINIPEKKLKPKQTGTKYFRTRHTQTDNLPLGERNQPENTKEQNISNNTSVVRSRNTSGKENNTRQPMNYVSAPDDNDLHETSSKPADQKSNKNTGKEIQQDSKVGKNVTKQAKRNISGTPNENKGFESPMEEHWGHLVIKLSEAEKYGVKKSFTHRDKVSRYKGVIQKSADSSSSKRQMNILHKAEPHESLISAKLQTNEIHPEYKRNETHSARSQRSISSTVSQPCSQNKYELQGNIDRDDQPQAGEIIRYIQRQNSWESGGKVKYIGDQVGRYSNGPEPIRRNRKPKQKINETKEVLTENYIKPLRWQSALDKQSEGRKESGVSRDIKLKRRATPSDDDFFDTRNTSAYDEILADVRKQYKEQERKQMVESK